MLAALGPILLAANLLAAPPDAARVPASIKAEGVPPIPDDLAQRFDAYRRIPGAAFGGWYAGQRQMLLLTGSGQTTQVFCLLSPGDPWTQLTHLRERAIDPAPRPGRHQFAFLQDLGGDEAFQVAMHDTRAGRIWRLTAGSARNSAPRWSRSGRLLAWSSTARNGRDMDIHVIEPENPRSARLLAEVRGLGLVADWSPDDSRLAVLTADPADGARIVLVDLDGGKAEVAAPRPGQTPLDGLGAVRWSKDGRSLYAAAYAGSEFIRVVRIAVDDGAIEVVSPEHRGDVEEFELSDDGALLAYLVNEGGPSVLHVLGTADGRERRAPRLPVGVARSLQFRPGSHEAAFQMETPATPSQVLSCDLDANRLIAWTHGPPGGLPFDTPRKVEPVWMGPADGHRVPALVYRPERADHNPPHPVLIVLHGGPEAQSRPGFLGPAWQYLRNRLGVALILPNVRGSTGYGRAYLAADDGRRREAAVEDVGAVLDWIADQPDLDAHRVAVAGESYGGYLTLASLVRHGDRLRAGVDVCGISDFVTYLEDTSDYRRDLRRAEYGDERDPSMREFLKDVSPLTRADKIRVPLLVAQGANDPRVPRGEAEQIVAAVRDHGGPVWYILARDEGHGFGRRTNVDYLHQAEILFLARYLVGRD